MTDVYDDKNELLTTKGLSIELMNLYLQKLHNGERISDDEGERARQLKLATNFPELGTVRQIIMDLMRLMRTHNINPKDVRW